MDSGGKNVKKDRSTVIVKNNSWDMLKKIDLKRMVILFLKARSIISAL